MLEKWEQYMAEGDLVGKGSGKTLIKLLESASFWAQKFNPDSETSPIPEDTRAEIILYFENLKEAMQKFYPETPQ